VCEAARQATVQREGIRPDRISVVYIGVPPRDIPRERRDELREQLGIPDGAYPVVGILANLREMKGHRHAIAALPAILQQFPNTHYLFAGRDDSNGAVAQFARELNVQNHISAPGFVQNSAEALAALDVFLLPSDWEGTPVSILEAMQAGVPVIATRVGGIPELVRDNQEGVLIEPKQPDQIARAVIDLTNDWPRRARLAKAAEARALTTFSIDQMTSRMEALYEQLLKRS
jgi:glycosyltransferase involved in cell wall biosynthesis